MDKKRARLRNIAQIIEAVRTLSRDNSPEFNIIYALATGTVEPNPLYGMVCASCGARDGHHLPVCAKRTEYTFPDKV